MIAPPEFSVQAAPPPCGRPGDAAVPDTATRPVEGGENDSRPRLLDLFAGAGGAARGYQLAGFHVTGVDITPQPRYAGDVFHQADAMSFPLDGFDAIHASPPCHDHSTATGRVRKEQGPRGTAWMLAATLERLRDHGRPFTVENVGTAQFPAWVYKVQLCGSSFGLDLRRHRLFGSNVLLLVPPCDHGWQTPRFQSLDGRRPRGHLASVVGVHGHANYAGERQLREAAMGIDWMSSYELTQAVPPVYTEYLGAQLLEHVRCAT